MPMSPSQRAECNKAAPSEKYATCKYGQPLPGQPDWAPVFLGAILEGSTVKRAAILAGVTAGIPYNRRHNDPEFAAAWREAANKSVEYLEEEAVRRAYHGTLKPVFQKGVQVGIVRQYSDTMLMFLLRARCPEVYGTERRGTHAPVGTVVNVNTGNIDARRQVALTGDLFEDVARTLRMIRGQPEPVLSVVPPAPTEQQVGDTTPQAAGPDPHGASPPSGGVDVVESTEPKAPPPAPEGGADVRD